MRRRLSIRTQLLVLVLAVALPATGLITYNIIEATNEARAAAYGQVHALASETASKLELVLHDNESLLARIAERPLVRALDPRNLDPIIRDFVQIHPELNNLGIRDLDANNIYSFRPNPSSAEEARHFTWFREGIQSGRFTAGNAFLGRLSKSWVSVMTFPVRDNSGAVSGLLNLSFDLLSMQARVMPAVPKDAVITVVDREDKLLMRSIDPAEWIGRPLSAPEAEQARGLNDGLFRLTGADRVPKLYAVATVASSGWRVFAGLPEVKVFAQIHARLTHSVVIGIAGLLLVLALAYWISAGIAKPIVDLARAALDIAKGGATHARIKGAAEVEVLSREIDRLVDERVREHADRAAVTAHYAQLVKLARDIFLLIDPSGKIVDVNDAAVAAYGYSMDELRSKYVRDLRAVETHATMEQDWQASTSPEGALFETVHRRKDGTTFPVEVSSRIIDIEGQRYRQCFVHDITERKRAMTALVRQKELYNTLSQTNQAIVRCANRDELFREICRIAVIHGHFRFASVRLVDSSGTRLRNAASYGDDAGYLNGIEVSTSPEEDIGRGPTGQAIRTGGHVISNEFINDSATAPWRAAARRAGVGASGAFPIRMGGAVVGTINLYSAEPGFFTGDILSTLDEMAVDVSFALDNFARDAGRKRAERELEFQTTVLLTQQETSLDGILLVDDNAKIVSWNKRFVELFHIPDAMVKAGNDALMLQRVGGQTADPQAFMARVQYLYGHRDAKGRDEIRLRDGRIIDRYTAPVVSPDGHYYGRVWYFRDITAQREMENSLAESEAKYRGLVEQDLTGIYIIQDGKFVYVNPHLARMFGYDENELIGVAALRLVAEPDRSLVEENIRRRIAAEEQSIQYTFRGQRKDGSWIDIGVHGSRASYRGKPAVIGLLQDITERRKAEEQAKLYLSQIEQSMLGTIDAVSAMVEMRDPYTSGHERHVSEIAVAIASEMGVPESDIKGLRIAGLVHDIGKIACPAEILSKPARLTAIEYELIQAHPQLGYDILKAVQFPWPIAQMVLQHHERLDGSGYPQKLKGDAIILPARILAVADTIEAMASHRPYRPGLGIEAALEEVEKQGGKLYDPLVVSACLRLFREKHYRLPV